MTNKYNSMLLTEFVRQNPFEPQEKSSFIKNDFYSTVEELQYNGWKLFGRGRRSYVYSKIGKPYVLKINESMDRGFLWFMFLTRKYPNVHFPKLMDVKILAKDLYVYKIEKLKELPNFLGEVAKYLERAIMVIQNGKYSSMNEYMGSSGIPSLISEYLNHNPELIRACDILGKNTPKQIFIDLPPFNFMCREDNTIVINDPYVYRMK